MQIYIAALHTNGYKHTQRYQNLNEFERSIVHRVPNILESYHYIHKQSFVDAIRESGDKIFLDSGAFSSYTLGKEIDLTQYCDYIKRNMDIIRFEDGVMMASVLDGIGDVELTYKNQLAMEAQGVRPLPCFHAGEDERYLDWYVANYDYITLGGMVGASTEQLMRWLDRMWDRHLTDGAGRPKIKVHGFGITSIPLMVRYPWYSCDSSSWIQATSFGSVVTPDYGPIDVSCKSPNRHVAGQHATTMSEAENIKIRQMFASQGFDLDRLAEVYESRAAYNLFGYMEMNNYVNSKNPGFFKAIDQELF